MEKSGRKREREGERERERASKRERYIKREREIKQAENQEEKARNSKIGRVHFQNKTTMRFLQLHIQIISQRTPFHWIEKGRLVGKSNIDRPYAKALHGSKKATD